MRVLNARQMREADRRTIQEIGIPSIVLMENAGRQVVAAIERRFPDLATRRVVVLSGRGNNGGDGFVIARTILPRSAGVTVVLIGDPADVKGDAATNLAILGRLGVPVLAIADGAAWELHLRCLAEAGLVIDALFGTGLTTPLTGIHERVVADLNATSVPVVSVDVPSGMSADTPELIGPSVHAALTVTMAALKLPLVLPPALSRAGEVVIADIGIPLEVIESVEGPRIELIDGQTVRALIVPRPPESHKGSFGHVLIVAGSRGKTGAAYLAAAGALRSGAGLVTVATPSGCQPVVAGLGAEYMTVPLSESAAGTVAARAAAEVLAKPHDVLAVGPGLGGGDEVRAFVRALVERATAPMVLDADALNAFASGPDRLVGRDGHDIIVTPHPGEMARLLGVRTEQVQADRLAAATELATRQRLYVVLKGHRTIVATPDGKLFVNTSGNPGMATGGTGDVLTGMVAAWLAQVPDAEAASKLAVFVHGAAGDLAAGARGEVAMTAGDVVEHIGGAILALTGPARGGR